ncbi:hypothetical protein HMPREF3104_10335 [Corynebacterium sp. HMSC30G07]|uniref:hypothetical protein n=1 Tax=Corynebacterium sp. HMSC30G07 TaxID=1581072 RepID=UPI0008A2BD8A|nr:hypothetical protein [Corynebacterium sp. HMSC30G07]OFT74052.1 hypothetical protein HMPREF3104_10335 [Corynebacterium sp. HMSC30G07]
MKRISTALVAAAVATGLAITPAVAEDAPVKDENTTAPAEGAETPRNGKENPEQPGNGKENPEQPGKDDQTPGNNKKKSGVTTGSAVGSVVGILSAILTAAIVIFSNPKGIDKAIDLLNANFGLGLQKFGF